MKVPNLAYVGGPSDTPLRQGSIIQQNIIELEESPLASGRRIDEQRK
jgi:hypothetical protein